MGTGLGPVDYSSAVVAFRQLPHELQAPSLYPGYVEADASRIPGVSPVFFLYAEGGECFYHAFHLSQIPGSCYYDIQSPYGYGGPVTSTDEPEFVQAAWVAYLRWCREQQVVAEFVRFHPLLENWRFYRGEILDDRKTVWVDLTKPDLLSTYTTRARTAIRKAQKLGLTVEWCNPAHFLSVFPRLYKETMLSVGADDFYFFSDEYYRQLVEEIQSALAVCCQGKNVLAAAIFLLGPQGMEYHLSASNVLGKKMGATNLILHSAAEFGARNGLKWLHLGGGTDARPENPLLFFKSGFSDCLASFKIGKYIHDVDLYQQMRKEWIATHGEIANRVLFYR